MTQNKIKNIMVHDIFH